MLDAHGFWVWRVKEARLKLSLSRVWVSHSKVWFLAHKNEQGRRWYLYRTPRWNDVVLKSLQQIARFCALVLRPWPQNKGAKMHLMVLRPLNAKTKGAEKRTESMNSDPYSAALFLRPWPQNRAQKRTWWSFLKRKIWCAISSKMHPYGQEWREIKWAIHAYTQ